MDKVILFNYGLNIPTHIEKNGRLLITQELSVDQLCNLWRNYFDFGDSEIVVHLADGLNMTELVKECFKERGFYIVN